MSPTLLGTTLAARRVVTTLALGLSTGIRVIAVSTLSVLAGRYQPCGALAASTCPVPASATTNADAATPGSFATAPDGVLSTTPLAASCGPPTGDAEADPRDAEADPGDARADSGD